MKHYANNNYAQSRIAGTICMFKGEPVYVHGFEDDDDRLRGKIAISCPSGNWRETVPVSEIDINPPRLGYFNPKSYERNAFFVARTPKRAEWRQGIRSSALVNGANLQGVMLNNDQIASVIKGDYPPLATAIAQSAKYGAKRAFHRDFAVFKTGRTSFNVEYKGVEVVANVIEGTISMIEGKQWAFEALQEAAGKNERFENEENRPAVASF